MNIYSQSFTGFENSYYVRHMYKLDNIIFTIVITLFYPRVVRNTYLNNIQLFKQMSFPVILMQPRQILYLFAVNKPCTTLYWMSYRITLSHVLQRAGEAVRLTLSTNIFSFMSQHLEKLQYQQALCLLTILQQGFTHTVHYWSEPSHTQFGRSLLGRRI